VVKVKGVNKSFGHLHVLKDVSLNVSKGEVVVVIGPSGSGKSTLLRCLNSLEPVQSGEIWIDGIRLDHHKTNIRAVRAEVGFVFQSFNLFPT
jgi:ABC-type polar amino acid transport system ATPase subunit